MAYLCRRLSLLLVFAFSFGALTAQSISGSWTGSYTNPGNPLETGTVIINWTATKAASNNDSVITVTGISKGGTAWDWRFQVANGPGNFNVNSGGLVAGQSTTWPAAAVGGGFREFYVTGSVITRHVGTPTGPHTLANPDTQKVTLKLKNDRTVPVTYQLRQGGTVVGQVTLQPGQGLIQTFTVPSGTAVEVFERVEGLFRDGDAWVAVDGAVTETKVSTVTPTNVPSGSTTTPPQTEVPQAPNVPTNPTTTPTRPKASPVWTSRGDSEAKDLLTNQVYREGVEKIIDADEAREEARNEAYNGVVELAEPLIAAALAAGESKAAEVRSKFAPVPSPPNVNSSGSAPNLTVNMPARFGGAQFNLNPFTSERFADVCSWFRAATAWLVIVLLGVWVWKELAAYVRGLPQMTGNKSNLHTPIAIPAVTGAATGAAVIGGIIVALITALIAWSFGDISVSALSSMAFTNPLVGMPAASLWMLDQLFPVATIVSALLARLAFNIYAAPLYAGASTVIRFVVS